MAKEIVSGREICFPVIGVEADGDSRSGEIRQVYGTAFFLGSTMLVTCAHVVQAASAHTYWGLATTENGRVKPLAVANSEVIEHSDIAILHVPELVEGKTFAWNVEEQSLLQTAFAVGFPMGLDVVTRTIHERAFEGHLVGSRPARDTELSKPHAIYELSFQCPRGLSGAALISRGPAGLPSTIIGIVFGNAVTEMNTFVHREEIREPQQTTIVQRYEAKRFMHGL